MKRGTLAIFLAILTLLTSCRYIVIEDRPAATAEPGLSSAEKQEFAARLSELGYIGSEYDDADAEQAKRVFARRNGVVYTKETEEDLFRLALSEDAVAYPSPLASGDRGEEVKAVQELLTAYGFSSGKADGIFGSATASAVKSFNRYLAETETLKLGIPASDPDSEVLAGETKEALLSGTFDPTVETLSSGAKGTEVTRLQNRLKSLDYLTSADGVFGKNTSSALSYFQKRNGLAQSGEANPETQKLLFSTDAKKSDRPTHPYLLRISTKDQKVYAYKWENGAYNQLVRTMVCSTGTYETPTPLGTFQAAGACGRWYYFSKFDVWAQYAYRITGGILIHSVLYTEKDTSTLRQGSVYNLGSRASHGCIRLAVEDAKWIYNNCPAGTTIKVV